MRVRFTQDVIFETEGRMRGPRFEAGSVHDLRDDLARRWIRREVAVPAEDAPAVPIPRGVPPMVQSQAAATMDARATPATGTQPPSVPTPPTGSDAPPGHAPTNRRKPGPSDPVKARGADDILAADHPDPGE